MSAKFASENRYMPSISDDRWPPQLAYGPPPGLSILPNLLPSNPALGHVMENTVPVHGEYLYSTSQGREASTEYRAFSARKYPYRP